MDNILSFQEIKIQSKLLPNNPDGKSGDTGDQVETFHSVDPEEAIQDTTVSPTQSKEGESVTVDAPVENLTNEQTVTDSTLGAETDTKVDVQAPIDEEDNVTVGTEEELVIEE